MEIIFDVDDLSPTKPGLQTLQAIKEHYPNFKVTCFTPATDQAYLAKEINKKKYKEWSDIIRSLDWIEICPHGLVHVQNEMMCSYKEAKNIIQSCEKAFEQFGIDFKRIWKSPYWQTSTEAYEALRDSGYVVAVDKNVVYPPIRGLEIYVYNRSLEQPITHAYSEPLKWHGHIGGEFYNDISQTIDSIFTMPTDAEFLTISEYLIKYGSTKVE